MVCTSLMSLVSILHETDSEREHTEEKIGQMVTPLAPGERDRDTYRIK